MFTYDELVSLVPKKQKTLITQSLVDLMNAVGVNDDTAEEFKQNFVTYSSIIGEGKYSVTEYKNAIQFITLLMLEDVTFPSPSSAFTPLYYPLQSQSFAIGSLMSVSWRAQMGFSMSASLGLNASTSGTSIKGYSASGSVLPDI